MAEAATWKPCSVCKKPVGYGQDYWACNVSTCNRKRTALVFCSVSCWDVHLPGANHREAWAVEKVAPSGPEPAAAAPATAPTAAAERPRRRIVPSTPASPDAGGGSTGTAKDEILVVASRLKDYVRARSGYNTSDQVLAPLSDILRRVADEAIENARRDGRQTVLDRDIPRG